MGFHERQERWACIVAHRRAGKTVACINDLIKRALSTRKENYRAGYIAPFRVQAKAIAWDYLKYYAGTIPGTEINESELRVDFPNGARIRLFGADNADALRGLYFDDVTLDEYADMDPVVWPQIIRPALSDRQGNAVFIGTPKGKNDFWRIWAGDMDTAWPGAINADDWFALMLKASETSIVISTELADARRMLTEDEYEQEYECSFDAAIKGAFYGQQIKRAYAENRIGRVPIERGLPVWTSWDLGISDSTAIWFGQSAGQEERIIGYYEDSGVGLDHYAKVLNDRREEWGVQYFAHYFPHDVAVRSLSTGVSRVETLKGLGIEATVVPIHAVMDGISATQRYLDRCWFDAERCKRGIEAITQYRRDYDEKLKTFRRNPLHDWTSHGADALRMRASMAPVSRPRSARKRYSGAHSNQSGGWMSA
ncbi:MAG: terminase large subunit domain-containing protein [Pikeienuella sp.]